MPVHIISAQRRCSSSALCIRAATRQIDAIVLKYAHYSRVHDVVGKGSRRQRSHGRKNNLSTAMRVRPSVNNSGERGARNCPRIVDVHHPAVHVACPIHKEHSAQRNVHRRMRRIYSVGRKRVGPRDLRNGKSACCRRLQIQRTASRISAHLNHLRMRRGSQHETHIQGLPLVRLHPQCAVPAGIHRVIRCIWWCAIRRRVNQIAQIVVVRRDDIFHTVRHSAIPIQCHASRKRRHSTRRSRPRNLKRILPLQQRDRRRHVLHHYCTCRLGCIRHRRRRNRYQPSRRRCRRRGIHRRRPTRCWRHAERTARSRGRATPRHHASRIICCGSRHRSRQASLQRYRRRGRFRNSHRWRGNRHRLIRRLGIVRN